MEEWLKLIAWSLKNKSIGIHQMSGYIAQLIPTVPNFEVSATTWYYTRLH